jgi:hypothetical protein
MQSTPKYMYCKREYNVTIFSFFLGMLGKDANLKSWKKCYCLGWITSCNTMTNYKSIWNPFWKTSNMFGDGKEKVLSRRSCDPQLWTFIIFMCCTNKYAIPIQKLCGFVFNHVMLCANSLWDVMYGWSEICKHMII